MAATGLLVFLTPHCRAVQLQETAGSNSKPPGTGRVPCRGTQPNERGHLKRYCRNKEAEFQDFIAPRTGHCGLYRRISMSRPNSAFTRGPGLCVSTRGCDDAGVAGQYWALQTGTICLQSTELAPPVAPPAVRILATAGLLRHPPAHRSEQGSGVSARTLTGGPCWRRSRLRSTFGRKTRELPHILGHTRGWRHGACRGAQPYLRNEGKYG